MFKNLKEKKLGDKGSPKPKASTPHKVQTETSTRDDIDGVDAKTTAQPVTPSNHPNEKEMPSINAPDVVAVITSSNASQEDSSSHKKVR